MNDRCVMYIAGPMGGKNQYNRPEFNKAEEMLEKDYIVINPAKLPIGMMPDDYMPICLQMVHAADAVCLLEGWRYSVGAKLEKAYADYRGIPVFELKNGELHEAQDWEADDAQ